MKNFLFDLVPCQYDGDTKYHGGGKYTKTVVMSFLLSPRLNDWNLYCVYNSTLVLDKEILEVISRNKVRLIDIKGETYNSIIKKNRISRMYTSFPPNELMYQKEYTFELYCTIHGLRHLEINSEFEKIRCERADPYKLFKLLHYYIFRNKIKKLRLQYYTNILSNANVIAVSQHTKFSIVSFFPELNTNVRVFYAPDVSEQEEMLASEDNSIDSGFYLLVSGNRWVKNTLRAIIALDQFFTENKKYNRKVRVLGITDERNFLKFIVNKELFIFEGYISEGELKERYLKAFALIYLSLNEGFGYPPLEAMKFETAVISSPFSSIPEICEDAVIYCNPYSFSEIKNRLLQLEDPKIYKFYIKKGSERYKEVAKRQEEDLLKMIDFLLQ